MAKAERVRSDFDNLVTKNGQATRIRYFTLSYSGTQYDQEYITASGNDIWFYGMDFPIDSSTGGADREYLEQGKILLDDRKVFIPGSVDVNSMTKIMFGSPTISQTFAPVDNGWIQYNISGVSVYNKVYIRRLNNGSFIDEV